eukprot:6309168-Pyramimonas_sp.AAC.2
MEPSEHAKANANFLQCRPGVKALTHKHRSLRPSTVRRWLAPSGAGPTGTSTREDSEGIISKLGKWRAVDCTLTSDAAVQAGREHREICKLRS